MKFSSVVLLAASALVTASPHGDEDHGSSMSMTGTASDYVTDSYSTTSYPTSEATIETVPYSSANVTAPYRASNSTTTAKPTPTPSDSGDEDTGSGSESTPTGFDESSSTDTPSGSGALGGSLGFAYLAAPLLALAAAEVGLGIFA